jgi:hypothetical protein
MDLLNVKHVLTAASAGRGRHQAVTWINRDFLPRAFLVGRSRDFSTYDEILAYMRTGEFDPASEVLLRTDGPSDTSTLTATDPGTAEIIKYEPNEVVIRVEARQACFLVVSDTYYPGWKVLVDDDVGELLRADYAFRAVRLTPGVHTVRMVYRPINFSIGVIFSAAGIALLAVLISTRGEQSAVRGRA